MEATHAAEKSAISATVKDTSPETAKRRQTDATDVTARVTLPAIAHRARTSPRATTAVRWVTSHVTALRAVKIEKVGVPTFHATTATRRDTSPATAPTAPRPATTATRLATSVGIVTRTSGTSLSAFHSPHYYRGSGISFFKANRLNQMSP